MEHILRSDVLSKPSDELLFLCRSLQAN